MARQTLPRQRGEVIRATRQERGLKPARLAELAECAPTTIYHLETNTAYASIELLHRIARALEVDVKTLIRDRDSEVA